MQRPLIYSVIFHVVLVVLATVGLPFFKKDVVVEETPIIVDLVAISERTAAPPPAAKPKEDQLPKPEPKKEELKPEPPKPEPPKPEPPKPEPPKPEPPKPEPPKAEPPKPEPPKPPEPKKEEPPPPEPKPEPKPAPPKPPEPKKEEPKKEPPKKDAFDDLLKNVEKMREKPAPTPPSPAAPTRTPTPAPSQSASAQDGPRIFNAPLAEQATMSEKDAMRKQIEDKWVYDSGGKGVGDMVVTLRLKMLPDGTVTDVRVVDNGLYGSNTVFRALADSAVRAVYKASPLRYPTNKYETFKDIEMNFRPPSGM